MTTWSVGVLGAMAVGPGVATAAVVTFINLPAVNSGPMPNPYDEAGFRVTPTAGTWNQAPLFGAAAPSIFGDALTGTVDVTRIAGGPFTFAGVDLADAGNGPIFATYTLTGLLGSTTVFSATGGPLANGFQTIAGPNAAAAIDRLRITLVRGTATYNVDNINVTAVPEPAVAGAAVVAAALMRRHRRAGVGEA